MEVNFISCRINFVFSEHTTSVIEIKYFHSKSIKSNQIWVLILRPQQNAINDELSYLTVQLSFRLTASSPFLQVSRSPELWYLDHL